MHILPAVQLLAVLSHLIARAIASPIAWPEEKLEAINALRARGTSEEEIAARFPRPLIAPGRVPIIHLSQYPTARSTDPARSAFEFEGEKGRNALSKQRRLVGTIGKRDQDLKNRA